jgi:hypothetical protein
MKINYTMDDKELLTSDIQDVEITPNIPEFVSTAGPLSMLSINLTRIGIDASPIIAIFA